MGISLNGKMLTGLMILIWCIGDKVKAQSEVKVPCLFIFGDSLVDNGNNNALLTFSKANYRPYGIDFAEGATCRFTNGRTLVDILGQLMGIREFIPSFARVRAGPGAINGSNFASGAAGIRDETGTNLGGHFSMNQQIRNFARVVEAMRIFFKGDKPLQDHLRKCILYCGLGSNDYLNNYFSSRSYPTSSIYNIPSFAASLVRDYSRQLEALYRLGARKFIIAGVGQIGCIPYELARTNGYGGSRCNETINNVINLFNTGLIQMVDTFNNYGQLPGSKFVFLDSFQSTKDVYTNLESYGFEYVDRGCCGVGRNNGRVICLPFENPCNDRTKYLFWDAFHPTETANLMFARQAFGSTTRSYTYPINIKQLAML